jgi:hypothetical protein
METGELGHSLREALSPGVAGVCFEWALKSWDKKNRAQRAAKTQKSSTRCVRNIRKWPPRVSRGSRDAGVICGGDFANQSRNRRMSFGSEFRDRVRNTKVSGHSGVKSAI